MHSEQKLNTERTLIRMTLCFEMPRNTANTTSALPQHRLRRNVTKHTFSETHKFNDVTDSERFPYSLLISFYSARRMSKAFYFAAVLYFSQTLEPPV